MVRSGLTSNLDYIACLLMTLEKFRFSAETMNATKNDLEPFYLGGASRCATRGKVTRFTTGYMLHFAAHLGLTIARLFLPESHREQMRKGLLSFHLHGFFYLVSRAGQRLLQAALCKRCVERCI